MQIYDAFIFAIALSVTVLSYVVIPWLVTAIFLCQEPHSGRLQNRRRRSVVVLSIALPMGIAMGVLELIEHQFELKASRMFYDYSNFRLYLRGKLVKTLYHPTYVGVVVGTLVGILVVLRITLTRHFARVQAVMIQATPAVSPGRSRAERRARKKRDRAHGRRGPR